MKPFYELTQRGRSRRLRQLAWVALESYDLDVTRMRLLQDGWNCTFRLDTSDGKKYALRVGYPNMFSPAEVRSEMEFIRFLSEETDLKMPAPVRTRNNQLLVTTSIPSVPEARNVVIFNWVNGADLADKLTFKNFERAGALAARMHQAALRFEPPGDFQIVKQLQPLNSIDEPRLLEYEPLTPEQRTLFAAAIDKVESVLAKLKKSADKPQIVHYDFHKWNIKVQRDQLVPIDFEDLAWAYPIQDIAIALYYVQADDRRVELMAAFRRGYETIQPWPEKYVGELEIFIANRAMDLLNMVISSNMPEDIEFAPKFVGMTEKRVRRLLQL